MHTGGDLGGSFYGTIGFLFSQLPDNLLLGLPSLRSACLDQQPKENVL